MRGFSRKILTTLLTAAMVFGLSGMTAFAAEADESGIMPLTGTEYNDITVYKNGIEVYTITAEAFAEAAALAEEQTLTYYSGADHATAHPITAQFVKVSDLLDGNEPDTGCGALVNNSTSNPYTDMDNFYLYDDTANNNGIRAAVDDSTGSYWTSGVTNITLGHYYNASGTCVICGAKQSSSNTYNVKYAVTLWGIKQDHDKYGNALGLTFGPATGADYRSDYRAHMTEEEYEADEDAICLHWMSWEEIAEQSRLDPTVFEDCLEYGCTHSVNITLNPTLLATTYEGTMNYGDGAGVLYDSIAGRYLRYNSSNNATGGWPASQIRAVLNGKDKRTGSNASDALDASDCLFSCFPSELQDAITAAAVTSDTVYDSEEESDANTTYDRLWLPSGSGVYEEGSSNNEVIRANEGTVSQRSSLFAISTTNAAALTGYDETGAAISFRLRSLSQLANNYVYLIGSTGSWTTGTASAYADVGIGPCFCLDGDEHEINESYYDVKYAVSVWGIGHDVDEEGNTLGLTFGPATGADYREGYTAHLTEEEYASGEYGVCLHWMSWNEIIRQSATDPSVFEECLKNGCTHAVNLVLNETILDSAYSDEMDDGDGAGYLYHSIKSTYRPWGPNTLVGWPASQTRAVLNGADELTSEEVLNPLDEETCLLSCFPEVLQDAIVAREVKSDIDYTSREEEDNQTTYDKLWCFSAIEIWGYSDIDYRDAFLRPLEGTLYDRSELSGITTSSYSALHNYNEEASTGHYWYTRTLNNDTQGTGVVTVIDSGNKQGYNPNNTNTGFAPGFCLAGPRPGDKAALETEVAAVEAEMGRLNPEDFTPASWEALEAALANAEEVLAKEGAYQAEIDTALEELETAMENLKSAGDQPDTVEKEDLEKEISEARALDGDDYTADSWAALQSALEDAETVLNDPDATAEEVEAAEEALKTAMDNLEKKPGEEQPGTVDKEDLEKEISEADALDENDYTADSWAALESALANAQTVLGDPNATAQEVEAAEEALKAAIDNLEKKTDDSGNGGNGGNGGNARNGLCQITAGKEWGYFVDGKVDTSYTGFAHNGNGDWYVVNGYIHFDQNTVAKDTAGKNGDKGVGAAGTWYYVVGNKVQHDFTGLAHYKNANGWWYITKGEVDFTHNGVDKNQNGWWYVKNGKVEFGHNGVDKNQYGWWYVTGGKVNFDFTGLANYKNQYGWWYIKDGKVDFTHNGVDKNRYGWWYVKSGKVDFGYNGRASNQYGIWNIVNGKVVF